jgi:hypothetical protein
MAKGHHAEAKANQAELSAPAILLVSVTFATLGMAIYTFAAAASGNVDLASQLSYQVQPQSFVR